MSVGELPTLVIDAYFDIHLQQALMCQAQPIGVNLQA